MGQEVVRNTDQVAVPDIPNMGQEAVRNMDQVAVRNMGREGAQEAVRNMGREAERNMDPEEVRRIRIGPQRAVRSEDRRRNRIRKRARRTAMAP
jgi:hypothetical protein